MNKTELIEYADYLLQTAMYKVDNIEDAEDLVQPCVFDSDLPSGYGALLYPRGEHKTDCEGA